MGKGKGVEVKEIRHNYQGVYDVFAAFVNLCISKRVIPYFMRDTKVHTFFYREKERHQEVLGDVMFDTNGNYPYSETIDEIFSNLTLCSMLRSFSPNFNPHKFSKAMLRMYKKIDPEIKRGVDEIAQRFYDRFICNSSGKQGKVTPLHSLDDLA